MHTKKKYLSDRVFHYANKAKTETEEGRQSEKKLDRAPKRNTSKNTTVIFVHINIVELETVLKSIAKCLE